MLQTFFFTFLERCQLGVIFMTAQSGFHLSVEKLVTLHQLRNRIGLKDLRHFLIQSNVNKPIVTHLHMFSHAFRQLHVIRVLIGSLYSLCPL